MNYKSLHEKELKLLLNVVEKQQYVEGYKLVHNKETIEIMNIVEKFAKDKKLIFYGGTAINNILPEEDKFYKSSSEIPDYDMFSKTALNDAKELAKIYFEKGFINTEAKSGIHSGTYKVFVNFIPIADITQIPTCIYESLLRHGVKGNKMLNVPPNFLKMSAYLELSRPLGDVSRWEKVYKRLQLLNKNYPLKYNCKNYISSDSTHEKISNEDYKNVTNELFKMKNYVYFGQFAISLYSKYLPINIKKHLTVNVFDILCENPENESKLLKNKLKNKFPNIKITKMNEIGEVIPLVYNLEIDDKININLYKSTGCVSYNLVHKSKKNIKIASIETILSLYLAFTFCKDRYNDVIDYLLCMCEMLINVQKANPLSRTGITRRFALSCQGKQKTLKDIRSDKSKLYYKLYSNKRSKEYEKHFLNYKPEKLKTKKNTILKNKKNKSRKKYM